MNRLVVLNKINKHINGQNYLEIGVQKGKIISKINASNKIGVDPNFAFTWKVRIDRMLGRTRFSAFEKESDVFFQEDAEKILKNGIDLAFIDGLHTYRQALRDAENCMKYLNDGGVIVMHDCNPLNFAGAYPVKHSIKEAKDLAAKGDLPGWNNCWNGDVWKAIAHLRLIYNDYYIFTLDLDWGLGVICRGKGEPIQRLTIEELERSDYNFLEKNRSEILNLKPPKYLDEFLTNKL